MPLPGNFATKTLNGNYVDLLGITANGSIQFQIKDVKALYDAAADVIVLPSTIVASITSGTFSVVLPASNDPDVSPVFTYLVTESFPSLGITRQYTINILHDATSPIDLADIVPIV